MQSSITFHIQSLEIVKCIATHMFTVNVEASEMNFQSRSDSRVSVVSPLVS